MENKQKVKKTKRTQLWITFPVRRTLTIAHKKSRHKAGPSNYSQYTKDGLLLHFYKNVEVLGAPFLGDAVIAEKDVETVSINQSSAVFGFHRSILVVSRDNHFRAKRDSLVRSDKHIALMDFVHISGKTIGKFSAAPRTGAISSHAHTNHLPLRRVIVCGGGIPQQVQKLRIEVLLRRILHLFNRRWILLQTFHMNPCA